MLLTQQVVLDCVFVRQQHAAFERVVEAPHIPTTDVIVSGADGRPLPDTDVWWRAADSTSTLRSANAAETTSTAVAQDVDQAWPLGDNRALIWRTSGELV